jgi:hypothetical protein
LPAGRVGATIVFVMTQDELLEIADPVERAGLADELMWTSHPHRTSLRTLRGEAIREALDAGRQATDVAARLRVTVADLQWMAGLDHAIPRQ